MHSKRILRRTELLGVSAIVVLCMTAATSAYADEATCGSLSNAYGPFDFTDPDHRANRIPIVEDGHLNDDVRALRAGVTSELPGADLDYTLRAVPNHHDALYAMSRYERKTGNAQPEGSTYTIDCWFDRAKRFAPHDGVVYLIHGIHLHKKEQYRKAEEQYLAAIGRSQNAAEVHYNLGLLYLDLEQLEDAQKHASIAYENGYPLPGLRMKLARHAKKRDE